MSDLGIFFVSLFLIVAAAVGVAALLSKKSREWLKPKESESDEKVFRTSELFWLLPEFIGVGGGVFGGVRYAYRAWQHAPPGSPAKLWWTVGLSAIAAFAAWYVLRLLDRAVNRTSEAAAVIKDPWIAQAIKTRTDADYARQVGK